MMCNVSSVSRGLLFSNSDTAELFEVLQLSVFALQKEIRKEVDEAIAKAKENPVPDPSQLFKGVHMKGSGVEAIGADRKELRGGSSMNHVFASLIRSRFYFVRSLRKILKLAMARH